MILSRVQSFIEESQEMQHISIPKDILPSYKSELGQESRERMQAALELLNKEKAKKERNRTLILREVKKIVRFAMRTTVIELQFLEELVLLLADDLMFSGGLSLSQQTTLLNSFADLLDIIRSIERICNSRSSMCIPYQTIYFEFCNTHITSQKHTDLQFRSTTARVRI